tara:strand:- start:601 stop:2994 length:2394 start_codon:yes stop_codon:yes gene_type:complete
MIYQLYIDAMAIEPEERDTFVRTKCKDKNILAQVLSLISADKTEFTLSHQILQESDLYHQQNNAQVGDEISVYRLTENLGQGGMGSVFKAQRIDGRFEQTVAIKIISPLLYSLFDSHSLVNEANFMAKLNYSDICSVFDAGVSEQGLYYIVMEFIEGGEISTYFQDTNISLNEKLNTFSTLCNAVNYAHQMQVVHGDLKPANILINQDKHIKVLDFGISQVINPLHHDLEHQDERLRGLSKGFASPELINGAKASVYSDIFALGKLLAQLIEQAKDRNSKGFQREIAAVISKATAVKATDRYASVSELKQDINLLLDGHVVSAYVSGKFYHFKKLVFNRHPIPFFVGFIFVACLAGLGINLAIQYQNLENEKHQTELMLEKFSLVLDLDFDKKSNIELSLALNLGSRGENDKARVLYDKIISRFDKLTNTDIAFEAGSQLMHLLVKEKKFDDIAPTFADLKNKLTFMPESNLPTTATQAMFYISLINSSYHRGVNGGKALFDKHTKLLQETKTHYWGQLNNSEKNRIEFLLKKSNSEQLPSLLQTSFYFQPSEASLLSNIITPLKNVMLRIFPFQSAYSVKEQAIRQFIESQAVFWSGTHVDDIEFQDVNKAIFSQGLIKIKENEGIYDVNDNVLTFDFGTGPGADHFIYLSSRIALTLTSDIRDLVLLTDVDIIKDNKYQPWLKSELLETTWYHIYDRAFYEDDPISPTLLEMTFNQFSAVLIRDEESIVIPWEIDYQGLLNLAFDENNQQTLSLQKVYRDEKVMILKNNTTNAFSVLLKDKHLADTLFKQWTSFF